jgi:septal ring factor EnvC (AmiA/AmiB activator)
MKYSVHIILLLVLLLISAHPLGAARDDIKKKEKALESLRKEIEQYEERIRDSEQKEKVTLERIDDYERQMNLLKSLLAQLGDEEKNLRGTIESTSANIDSLERQLTILKRHYAQYVASVYKYGRIYDFETLLSSNSVNQLYIRIQYLRRFSEQRQRDLNKMVDRKVLLEHQQCYLQESLAKERTVIAEKQREQISVHEKNSKRKQALLDIRNDKSVFRKELIRKTRAAEQLNKLIADLIEQERIQKARERALEREKQKGAKYAELPTEVPPTSNFGTKRGVLPWPVTLGNIVAQFGDHVHPQLKTVTQNTGVDIAVPQGTPIKAVAEAEVAMIHWLPSYGNLIILNHYGGYRTVYAHLSDISVVEGQKVKEGSVIAKSGDSVAGNLLHFELWKEKEKQDPEAWLAHRKR